jgi:hypothetical protein
MVSGQSTPTTPPATKPSEKNDKAPEKNDKVPEKGNSEDQKVKSGNPAAAAPASSDPKRNSG